MTHQMLSLFSISQGLVMVHNEPVKPLCVTDVRLRLVNMIFMIFMKVSFGILTQSWKLFFFFMEAINTQSIHLINDFLPFS